MQKKSQVSVLIVVLAAVMLSAGCAKKAAKVTPPAAPTPATPTATLAANPSVIHQGQTAELTWATSNASRNSVAGLGTLRASGSRSVDAGLFHHVRAGRQGSRRNRRSVSPGHGQPKVAGVPASHGPTDEDLFSKNVKDVFFDYDKFNVRPNEEHSVEGDAAFLAQHPKITVLVEGHCDDRGSDEYNLALGASRAESVKQTLLQQGVPDTQIKTISYGKEKPFCTQDNEQCWQQNRVAHFTFER